MLPVPGGHRGLHAPGLVGQSVQLCFRHDAEAGHQLGRGPGRFRGLLHRQRRGGFEVDLAWHQGRLTAATIRAAAGGRTRLVYGNVTRDVALKAGESLTWDGR